MSNREPTVGKTAWLTQYIATTRSRYQHAAVEHQRNALRLEGAAMALRELSDAVDATEPDSTATTDETPTVGQQ
ncbi:MAG: hypothetical protein ABGY41_06960 [Candidatus Poribacteria bacterium]